jgi:hypothetical protein
MIFHLLSSLESPYFIKKIMEYYDYNRICDDAVINTITARVVEELEKKMEKLAEQQNSPYIFGIDGLARYIGIGETMAQELKNNNEIPCSQRGRKIWFEKKEVEKFMRKNRV